jgi:hypothetical protein
LCGEESKPRPAEQKNEPTTPKSMNPRELHVSFTNLWNQTFASRQSLDYSNENKPYVEYKENPDVDVIRFFMRNFTGQPERCLHQAEAVEGFCSGASLEALQGGVDENIQRPVALLDDRSNTEVDSQRGYCRPHKGPLTASQLFQELKKQVWKRLKPILQHLEVAELTSI